MMIETALQNVVEDLEQKGLPAKSYDAICMLIADEAICNRLHEVCFRNGMNVHLDEFYTHVVGSVLFHTQSNKPLLDYLLNG